MGADLTLAAAVPNRRRGRQGQSVLGVRGGGNKAGAASSRGEGRPRANAYGSHYDGGLDLPLPILTGKCMPENRIFTHCRSRNKGLLHRILECERIRTKWQPTAVYAAPLLRVKECATRWGRRTPQAGLNRRNVGEGGPPPLSEGPAVHF